MSEKLTQRTQLAVSAVGDDLLHIVIDAGGTPLSFKVSLDQLADYINSIQDASDVIVDDTNFDVIIGTEAQTALESIDSALLKARGTEVLGGTGAVTFVVGTTVFDVAATVGQIKDSTGYYAINYAGATGIAVVSTIVSSIYVYIDKAGNLQQQTTEPTRSEYREKLFITRLALLGGTLRAQEEIANPSGQYTNLLRDYLSYISSPKKGLALSPNADLTFQVAAGSIFELGVRNATDADNPSEGAFSLQNPAEFIYVNRNSTIGEGLTSLNVTQYDNNGTTTTMANNRFKIMTVYKFNSGNHIVQNGQAQYSSLDEAQTAISTRSFVNNPVVENGTRLGWIIVQKNATDLTDTSKARFVNDTGSFSTNTTTVGALLASNNLNDVDNPELSRDNIEAEKKSEAQTLVDGVTIDWDLDSGNIATVTLGGNRTLNFPTNLRAGYFTLKVIQDGTGSRTLAFDSSYQWSFGSAPSLSTGAGEVDVFTFTCDGTNVYGTAILNFS